MNTLSNIEITDNMISARRNHEGWTPLILAAATGKVGAVRLFLEIASSKTVNATDNNGMTALMHAVANGRYGVVRVFIASKKTNATSETNSGKRPQRWPSEMEICS